MFSEIATELAGDRIKVLNLARIGGSDEAVLRCLSDEPGVYAWFKNFAELDATVENQDPHAFYSSLHAHITAKQCIDRKGSIPPLYRLKIKSRSRLSKSKLAQLLKQSAVADFRRELHEVLAVSLLFSGPLYVGRASNLKKRINDHLSGKTDLRANLKRGGINIRHCWLAILRLPVTAELSERDNLVEDVLSRLFRPSFSEKYG